MPSAWRPYPDATTASSTASSEQVRFSAALTLAAMPTAVGAARRYIRNELTNAKLAVLIDDAELVVSELVTNAVIATGVTASEPTWPQLEGLAVIRIRLGFSATSVFVEVWDREAVLPAQRQPGEDEEDGRGLLIVSVLCGTWGVRAGAAGKVVWAELPMPVPTELPRRLPKQQSNSGVRGTNGSSYRAADRSNEEVRAMRRNGGGG